MRALTGGRLLVASHNPGKVAEFDALLRPRGIRAVSAAEAGLPEPPETGASFAENAWDKARDGAIRAGLPALGDDSGLAVAALCGAPGIYSARWAGPSRDFRAAAGKIQAALEQLQRQTGRPPPRHARFVCALAICWPDGEGRVFEGTVEGEIVWPPRGDRGFGYDPIFVPEGWSRSFAEIDPAVKERHSHRAAAFARLVAACLPAGGGRPGR